MAIDKRLLIHWWHYYGKVIYTLAELEEFEKVIDEYGADKVLDVAVASYVCGDGSPTIMLASIRKGTVKKLFESLSDVSVGRFSPFRVGLKTPISVNLKSPMHHVCY